MARPTLSESTTIHRHDFRAGDIFYRVQWTSKPANELKQPVHEVMVLKLQQFDNSEMWNPVSDALTVIKWKPTTKRSKSYLKYFL